MAIENEIANCERQIQLLGRVVNGMIDDGLQGTSLYLDLFFKVWQYAQKLELLMFLDPDNRLDLSGEEIRMN